MAGFSDIRFFQRHTGAALEASTVALTFTLRTFRFFTFCGIFFYMCEIYYGSNTVCKGNSYSHVFHPLYAGGSFVLSGLVELPGHGDFPAPAPP